MRTIVHILVFALLAGAILAGKHFGYISETAANSLLAGLIPLLGVLLTLNWNQRQFLANLVADREKSDDSRKFTAKQAAFIRAVEAVVKSFTYFGTLPDRVLPKNGESDKEVQDLGPALYHLHFFCEFETIKEVVLYEKTYAVSLGEVLISKMDAMKFDWEIEFKQKQITDAEKRIERLNEELLVLLRADVKHALLDDLRAAISQTQKRHAELNGELSEVIKKRYAATECCRDVTVTKLELLSGQMTELLLCARRELHFPIEEQDYSSLMREHSNAIVEWMRALVQSCRKKLSMD